MSVYIYIYIFFFFIEIYIFIYILTSKLIYLYTSVTYVVFIRYYMVENQSEILGERSCQSAAVIQLQLLKDSLAFRLLRMHGYQISPCTYFGQSILSLANSFAPATFSPCTNTYLFIVRI